MNKVHNTLIKKISWYRSWHKYRHSSYFHWFIFLLAVMVTYLVVNNVIDKFSKETASVRDFAKVVVAQTVPIPISKTGDWVAAINKLQPGNIGQLESGKYTNPIGYVTVKGTAETPITLHGAGHLETIIDGEGLHVYNLRLDGAEYINIENLQIMNPSAMGNPLDPDDPNHTYSNTARNKLDPLDPKYSPRLSEGITITYGSKFITIRDSYFHDIATRGIFIGAGGAHNVTIEHNLFLHVGDDTAGGDIEIANSATNFTIRENLFGGNVDGVVVDIVGAGHLIENNLIVSHNWEDGIDIKAHWPRGAEYPWSIIRHNVIYAQKAWFSGLTLQNDSDNVKVYENVIHGHAGAGVGNTGNGGGILVYGRDQSATVDNGRVVSNHHIVGNWFDAYGSSGPGRGIVISRSSDPVRGIPVRDVWVMNNIFSGYDNPIYISQDNNYVYNNIIEKGFLDIRSSTVLVSTNLFAPSTTSFGTGSIVGSPIYMEQPVGPLATNSPGKGVALKDSLLSQRDEWQKEMGYSLGDDIGFSPQTHLLGLEKSVLTVLSRYFTEQEIRDVMEQGGLTYQPPTNQSPVISSATASPASGAAPLSVNFTATATDSDGAIASYAWDFGDSGTASVSNPSHIYNTAGTYTAQITVMDNGGAIASASVTITANPASDTTPPTVGITTLLNGATVAVKSTMTLSASATDNVGVTQTQFFINGNLLSTDITTPYTASWKVPAARNKTYQIQATASDKAGNIGRSAIIKVTVK